MKVGRKSRTERRPNESTSPGSSNNTVAGSDRDRQQQLSVLYNIVSTSSTGLAAADGGVAAGLAAVDGGVAAARATVVQKNL